MKILQVLDNIHFNLLCEHLMCLMHEPVRSAVLGVVAARIQCAVGSVSLSARVSSAS